MGVYPSTYLSIDIDFWYHRPKGAVTAALYLDEVAQLCQDQSIILRAVMNHHQMLPLVDSSGATTLVNLDLHSDLADSDVGDFNCGTWASYCKARKHGHYHWIQGDAIDEGECNHPAPIWSRNGRHKAYLTDWGSIQRTYTKTAPSPSTLVNHECVGVGVCLSPCYCGYHLGRVFHDWRKRWAIPYRKGRANEYGPGVARCPR
jgi:hypothetical protein